MKKCFYPSLVEAQQATQALGITSLADYQQRYREDPRLPSTPYVTYAADWQSWPQFLGTADKFYATYAKAQQATQALGITSVTEYQQRRREDPRLPSTPYVTYAADWQSWPQFLGTADKFYPTFVEAQQATQALRITLKQEYLQRRREDPRLPATPDKIYPADWQSWPQFLGTADKFYPTYAEAQQATQALGITSLADYQQRYREDPRLPSTPYVTYAADWQSWPQFLGTADKFYATYAEAQQATQALRITLKQEYLQRRREDPRLPANPDKIYPADWQSWPQFLGTADKFYATYAEAQQATQALGITSVTEYQQRRREDPRLPRTPNVTYADDWQSWAAFLLPNRIDTLRVLKNACKALGIRDSRQYRQIQKDYAQLPSKPDKKFNNWIDWYDLLDIPKPYELHELKK